MNDTQAHETRERVKFNPKPTGSANWKLRLGHLIRSPFRRTVPAVVCSVIVYLVAYNVGMRLWKGNSHPVNRFFWRIQEADGTLDPELRLKKQIVNNYYKSRIYDPPDVKPHFE